MVGEVMFVVAMEHGQVSCLDWLWGKGFHLGAKNLRRCRGLWRRWSPVVIFRCSNGWKLRDWTR